jgi:sigma-E factor negative regulatory protein RseA
MTMSEQLGESLSAVMDGEASEQDLESVLEQLDEATVRQTWSRFQAARQCLDAGAQASQWDVDLSRRIMSALEDDPSPVMESPFTEEMPAPVIRPVGRWQQFARPVASFAVAASVFAAVFVGTQYFGSPADTPGADGPPAVVAERLSAGGMVNTLGGTAVRADFATPGFRTSQPVADYDGIARDRLRRYLLPHTEEATLNAPQGMMPFARVASFEVEE